MSYGIVLGDLGPVFDLPPLYDSAAGAVFVLDDAHDTATLHYTDPLGTAHSVALAIVDATNGLVSRTWVSGDLPVVGTYVGMVHVSRSTDVVTFPRSFPDDGSKILWNIYSSI